MITSNNTIIYRLFGCVIVAVALLTTCDKLKTEDDILPPLVLSKESRGVFESGISFPSESPQAVTIQFTASHKWSTNITDTKTSSWLTVEPSKGEPGDVTMTISAMTNEGENARSALFTIQCDTLKRSFTVTQAGSPVVHVQEVVLEPRELTLVEGESRELKATVLPQNAKDKTLTWSTSDESVAAVTEGVVTAVNEGSAVITASAEGKSATCNVTVSKKVIPVESVILDRTSVTLVEGSAITLVATVLPEDATDKTVTWESSDPSTVSVTDGEVSTLKEGMAYIIAKAGNKTASCTVTVKKKVVDVTSVSLNKTTLALKKGESETIVATVLPEDATDRTVTWTSSDTSVARVDQTGKVTATGGGSATITAKAGEKTATCAVTVTVPVSSITIDRQSITLEQEQSSLLTATVLPADATDKTITWESSDPTVASVTEGRVTAVKEGVAYITAKAGEKSATCKVTVQKKVVDVTSVSLNKTTLALKKGESETLVATVLPEDATDKTVTWTSSDTSVARVDQTGKVTATGGGSATITAKAGEKMAKCTVTVTVPVESITLDVTSVTLEEWQTTLITATVSPADATNKTVSWSSSNTSVASVSGGLVTAKSEGTAVITAKAGEKTATCNVTVKKKIVAVTSVVLNKTSISLNNGESETLIATVYPSNATDKTVSWSSSDPTVVSVDQAGKVTANGAGTANITARAGEQSAVCQVTVVIPITGLELYDDNPSVVRVGESVVWRVKIIPEDATERTLVWSVLTIYGDPSCVTVDNDGKITGLKEGTSTVQVGTPSGNPRVGRSINVLPKVVPVESITLDRQSLSLNKGESETLVATVLPTNATDKTVTWSSSNISIADVDQNGVVTATGGGSATITAKAGEKTTTCAVTVTVPVESVTLDVTSVTLEEWQTTLITATVSPSDATNKTVSWTSSNTSVATVSGGLVTAKAEGIAVITAQAGEMTATCNVTVKKTVIAVTSVTLNKAEITLNKGDSETLYATVYPTDATDKTVTWSSSEPSIVSVDQNGKVTANGAGTATITARAGEQSAVCQVTVVIPITGLEFYDDNPGIVNVGESVIWRVKVIPEDATETPVWSVFSGFGVPSCVAVVIIGKITGIKEGDAMIQVRSPRGVPGIGSSISVLPRVVPVESITLDYTSLTINKGQSTTLNATVYPYNATDKTMVWESSNPGVASVDQVGKVTAKAGGQAAITAKAGDHSATCNVTVNVPVESIELGGQVYKLLYVGDTFRLIATVYPEDATDRTVTWSSSNPSVASVSDGLITALSEGNTIITAKAGDKTASCEIGVENVTVPVTSISLNKMTLVLNKGESETLVATVLPVNATDKTVTWESSEPSVMNVDQSGKVIAVSGGSATITAKVGSCIAYCYGRVIVPVTSISLDRQSIILEELQSTVLTATVLPEDATDKSVAWESSDPTVVTVSDGMVTAEKEGMAYVVAKSGSKSASCVVTVKKGVVPVTHLFLDKNGLTLEPGQSERLTATVLPDNATDKTVTWQTSDPSVATVSDGLVTAVSAGEAKITASCGEEAAFCWVTVKQGVIPVESVVLDRQSVTLEENQSTLLTATVLPENATDKTVTWESSDPSTVSVTDGEVSALKEGMAYIIAKAGNKTASCTVTVKKKVVDVISVSLNKSTLALKKGESETLVATVLPEDATDRTVTWTSSDTSVARVDQTGKVTATGGGSATITAKAGEKSATCKVTVTVPVTSVTLDRQSVTLEEDQSTLLTATVTPEDATDKTVTWISSAPDVASVSEGRVTALKEGVAVITAKAGEKSATCTVTVKKKIIAVTSISLNKTSLGLKKGESETLVATVLPSDATDKTVSWSSSNESIASVDQAGKVTALSGGEATITAKAGEKSATCKVTVTVPVTSVTLDRQSVTLEENQSTLLTATVLPENATDKTVTWESSDPSTATVYDGHVTALKEGVAYIVAKAGNKSATCVVTVKKGVVPVTSVWISYSSLDMNKGESMIIQAIVYPDNATDKTITWSSSAPSVVSVDQSGQVTALAGGQAVITAKAGDKESSCIVNVFVPVISIALDKQSVTLEEGQCTQLLATILPEDASDKTIRWTTSNESIVTVSGGRVNAIKEGTATIYAYAHGGLYDYCDITVKTKGPLSGDPEGFTNGGDIEW